MSRDALHRRSVPNDGSLPTAGANGVVSSADAAGLDNQIRVDAGSSGGDYEVLLDDWIGEYRWVEDGEPGSVVPDTEVHGPSAVWIRGSVGDRSWSDDEAADEIQFENDPDVIRVSADSGVRVTYNGSRVI